MSILIYFATIFWSLFPNLIHVFQSGEDFINKVNETNLVSNGDLNIDTNDDNIPDGFALSFANANSLVDGIFTFAAMQQYSNFRFPNNDLSTIDDTYYIYSRFKSPSSKVRLLTTNPTNSSYHSGSNTYEYHSYLTKKTSINNAIYIEDSRISDFTPISVDFIGAYNVTDMITKGVKNDNGILFNDLTNEEIKIQLDTWIVNHGDLSFTITKDNTSDAWFNTGFVQKEAERDFIDYLGYFFWLFTPPIILFITLDLIRRLL